jgi:hypothetical protein
VLKNFATAVAIIVIGIAASLLPVFHVCVAFLCGDCAVARRRLALFLSFVGLLSSPPPPFLHSPPTLPRPAAHKLRPQSPRSGSARSSWCAASFSTRGPETARRR